jgi:hypothetical protein
MQLFNKQRSMEVHKVETLQRKLVAKAFICLQAAALLLWPCVQSANASANAATCGYPNGPKSGTMIADVNEWKACNVMPSVTPAGEFGMTLSNMPADSALTNGIYGAYCVDMTGTILDNPQNGEIVYSVDFWSSLDPNLPTAVKQVTDIQNITYTIPWDKINYLLNKYPNESWLNLQAAYWDLVHGCTQQPGSLYTCDSLRPATIPFPFGPAKPYGCPTSNPPLVNIDTVQSMVNDANANGNGFIPRGGAKIASVGQIKNCTPAAICNQYLPYQVMFIPTTCPTCNGSIGNYVWKDLNGNGIQDSNEPGMPNVQVQLSGTDAYGQPINLTSTTDSSGKYQFSQLCSGDYRVTVNTATLPEDVISTSPTSTNGNDNNPADSNDPAGTIVTISNDATSNMTVDFGYVPLCNGSIGNLVWKDLNANGIQDEGAASGMPGVKVQLTGINTYNLPVNLSAITDATGAYSFQGLCQGDYTVTVDPATIPASFAPTSPTSSTGNDFALNDSNNPAGTSVYLSNDSSPNPSVDFGYVANCSGSIGNFVWKDLNENGTQDSGEPGIQNVTVALAGTNTYGQLVSMTSTTDASGKYVFNGICQGQYTVTVNPSTIPTGWAPTTPLSADGSDGIPLDSNNPAGTSVNQTSDNTNNPNVDFGYVPNCSGSIGNLVWIDQNQNGIQDPNEQPLDNVQVLLTGTNFYGQTVTISDITKNGGMYQFKDLCKGDYTVSLNTAPLMASGFVATSPRSSNGNDMVDVDSNEPIGTAVSLSNDTVSNQTVDFGFFKPCTSVVGDFVWNDLNQNGIQDANEPGIAGVSVTLTGTNAYGMPVSKNVITLADGGYQFTEICQGTYTVNASTPAGFTPALTGKGTATSDSNGSPATVTVASDSAADLSVDFGFFKPCSGAIGDFVWNDLNQNGIQDANEPGIAGVNVTLSGTNAYGVAVNKSFITLADGSYQFTDLCQGTYTVTAPAPAGFTATVTAKGTAATDSNGSPATVTLASDTAADQSIDFGFFKPCSSVIGDFVWNDLNQNGIQDANEPGLAGVSVTLIGTNAYGVAVSKNVLTLTDGSYQFTDICQGTYAVSAFTPTGYTATATGKGSATTDSNGSPSTVVVASDTAADQSVDFGFFKPCSGVIGDFVWNDLNQNGIQDANEPGIAGVNVTLSGTNAYGMLENRIVTTQANGSYQFTEICKGTYTVTAPTPAGYTAALTGKGTATTDSNGSPATVTLTSDTAADQSVDFGFFKPCSSVIGDFVWNDLNQNGIQDANEPGLAGVSVTLIGTNAYGVAVSKNVLTLANGSYQFTDICQGTYTVTAPTPAGYTATATGKGTATTDSNGSPATVVVASDTAADQSVDFGFFKPCTSVIGDFVWNDLNQNGIQDANEPGLAGVNVTLTGTNAYGVAVSKTFITLANGSYQFTDICQGTYTVSTSTPAGFTPALTGKGTATTDSNGSPATVTVASDTAADQSVDFGFFKPCSGAIGDFVWNDLNQNGIQDANEPGIPGVNVTLSGTNAYGVAVSKTFITLANGSYQFTDICQGTYTVNAPTPAGYTATMTGKGTTTTDSNGSPATVTLASDTATDQSVDFGFFKPCAGIIGDFVWNDLNQNGIQDANEPGIPGVNVTLSGTNAYGIAVNKSFITLANGSYQFTDICQGTYTVTAPTPAGYTATLTGKGTTTTDSNGSPATVTLASDTATDQSVDFGFFKPCTGVIGDFVWNDLNQNGIQDANEAGIAGVNVTLTGTNAYGIAVNKSFTTLANGSYQFTDICKGTYTITAPTPAGYTAALTGKGTAATDSNGSPATVTLASDTAADQSVDFGFVKPCTSVIGDFVWNDLNQNGIQDANEPGLAGVNVTLSGTNAYGVAVSKNVITLANGSYQFSDICKGTYIVTASTPAGYTAAATGKGTSTTDSNGSPATVVVASDTAADQSVDFGFFKPCSGVIGDFVWNDLNLNGIQDANEAGIAGINVTLTGTNAYGVAVSKSFITLANGSYQFTDICKGTYTVTAPTPAGYTATLTGKGTVTTDSNGSPATVTLASDTAADQSIDFGFAKPCVPCTTGVKAMTLQLNWRTATGDRKERIRVRADSITGQVLYDTSTDSLTTDPGLPVGANFSFNVPAAAKKVVVTVLGVNHTTETLKATFSAECDLAIGSTNGNTYILFKVMDATFDGEKTCSTPPPVVCTGSIGNFVWNDANQNGIQDTSELGLAGATVTLTGTDYYGKAVNQSITTPASGAYAFTSLCQGTYKVSTSIPTGYTSTLTGKGTVATDSNSSPATVTLANNAASDQTIDFGFFKTCVACKDGVTNMTLQLNWRTSTGDRKERIRVRADSMTGQVLYDTSTDSLKTDSGLPVGANFSFAVPPAAKKVYVTVLGVNHTSETLKATFSAECDLTAGTTSGNSYIIFKVIDATLDGATTCGTSTCP